jgi:NADPH-dependent glutamate synthase beta subunit-like oxidoreductase
MDSARTAKRMGAEASIILYRRTRKEMPARAEETHHAEEEGIQFEFLVAPLEILGNEKKWVTGVKCVRMQLGEADASGRARPVPIAGSEFIVPCEVVVAAVGTRANPLLTAFPHKLRASGPTKTTNSPSATWRSARTEETSRSSDRRSPKKWPSGRIWGPPSPVHSLEERITRAFSPPLFPIELADTPANVTTVALAKFLLRGEVIE